MNCSMWEKNWQNRSHNLAASCAMQTTASRLVVRMHQASTNWSGAHMKCLYRSRSAETSMHADNTAEGLAVLPACTTVFSSTNISTSLPPRTSSQWSFQSRQCQHVATYGRQVKVTWQYRGPELLASALEVSQSLVHHCGILCRMTWNSRLYLSHSFVAS